MKKAIIIVLFAVFLIILAFAAFEGGVFVAEKIDHKLGFKSKNVAIDMNQEKDDVISEKENLPESAASQETIDIGETSPIGIGETASEKITFAIIGDSQYFNSGNPNGSLQSAIKNIKNQNVNLVFAVGDIISSCDGGSKCQEKLNQWKSVIGTLFSKTYVMMGNHDRTGKDKSDAIYQRFFNFPINGPAGFSELAYSFDFGNSHFIILDSDKPKEHIIDSTQRNWLEQDLAKNKGKNVFVFFHEPAYPTGNKIKESLDVNPKDRDALWNILVRYKVKGVFSGHEHIQSRRNVNGIYQFVFGNTDVFLHDNPKPGMAEYFLRSQGYGIVEIEGNKTTVKTFYINGKLANTFSF